MDVIQYLSCIVHTADTFTMFCTVLYKLCLHLCRISRPIVKLPSNKLPYLYLHNAVVVLLSFLHLHLFCSVICERYETQLPWLHVNAVIAVILHWTRCCVFSFHVSLGADYWSQLLFRTFTSDWSTWHLWEYWSQLLFRTFTSDWSTWHLWEYWSQLLFRTFTSD